MIHFINFNTNWIFLHQSIVSIEASSINSLQIVGNSQFFSFKITLAIIRFKSSVIKLNLNITTNKSLMIRLINFNTN
jgi:hypothetical protein